MMKKSGTPRTAAGRCGAVRLSNWHFDWCRLRLSALRHQLCARGHRAPASNARAQFASNVDRSQEVSKYLRKAADAIQIYWLSGYIFFGSFLTFRLAVPSAVAELEHCLAAKQMLSWQFGKCLVHSKRVRSGFLSAQASDRAPMTTLSPTCRSNSRRNRVLSLEPGARKRCSRNESVEANSGPGSSRQYSTNSELLKATVPPRWQEPPRIL
jgi:hypothetical protein